jgi:hypothetical protein
MLKRARKLKAAVLAVALAGGALAPVPAQAFFCFSFQIGAGPRYSYWAQNPFSQWYGPTVTYPGYGEGPPRYAGGLASPWSAWRGGDGHPLMATPYGFNPYGYVPYSYSPYGSGYGFPGVGGGSPFASPWTYAGSNPFALSPTPWSYGGLPGVGGW